MNAWRKDYRSWSRNVEKVEELKGMGSARKRKGSGQRVHLYREIASLPPVSFEILISSRKCISINENHQLS